MRNMLLVGLLAGLTACSVLPSNPVDALTALRTQVSKACLVVQPTLVSLVALDPNLATVAQVSNAVCLAAPTLDTTSVQALLDSGIPAIEQAV